MATSLTGEKDESAEYIAACLSLKEQNHHRIHVIRVAGGWGEERHLDLDDGIRANHSITGVGASAHAGPG